MTEKAKDVKVKDKITENFGLGYITLQNKEILQYEQLWYNKKLKHNGVIHKTERKILARIQIRNYFLLFV